MHFWLENFEENLLLSNKANFSVPTSQVEQNICVCKIIIYTAIIVAFSSTTQLSESSKWKKKHCTMNAQQQENNPLYVCCLSC